MDQPWNQPRMPIITSPSVSVPEPLALVVPLANADYGLTPEETMRLGAGTPIFQKLLEEVVQHQIKHEEDQLRAWLAAIINDPAGRKIIEEML